jgi:hypothetical protein
VVAVVMHVPIGLYSTSILETLEGWTARDDAGDGEGLMA